MPLRKSEPYTFTPIGLTDSPDQTTSFPGACRMLQNLVVDRYNLHGWTSRPGVTVLKDITAAVGAGAVISVAMQIGSRVYGLAGPSGGTDAPFCYDLGTAALVTVTVAVGTTLPNAVAITGDWTPPTMALVSTKLLVTHPNTTGLNVQGYYFDLSNPAAPTFNKLQVTVAAGAQTWIAQAVSQFGNRAWYSVGNVVYYSDVLVPQTITNANQILTVGDTTNITASVGLPLSTSSQGVLQALILFKDHSIWQVTGDSALSTLALNQLSGSNGCVSPRTIVATPVGLLFMEYDGIRIVNQSGVVDYFNIDIVTPFTACTRPSRACAVFSNGTYRISLDTTFNSTSYTPVEFWFDFISQKWSGPHTFGFHVAVPYPELSTTYGGSVILARNDVTSKLLNSQIVQASTSVFTDNGASYQINLKTASMPDTGDMMEKCIVESTVELAPNQGPQNTYTFNALNDSGSIIGTCGVTTQPTVGIWGTGTWGTGTWSANSLNAHVYTMKWDKPIVTKKLSFSMTSTAIAGTSVKQFNLRYQVLGYMNA